MKPKVIHYTDEKAVEFGHSAPGTAIRNLISDKKDNAPFYNMRMIEIKPDGHTPKHEHPYEHENFIVQGQGKVFINGSEYDLKPGDVVFVPPNALHQYSNTGQDTFKFLCSIPAEKYR